MDKPGNRYALSALRDKRASLAGEIEDFKRKIKYRERALRHVDAVLRVMAPGADPSKLPKKRPQRVKLFRQGDLGRMLVEVLRKAARPLTVRDIVTAMLAMNGMTDDARPTMRVRVQSNLPYLAETGRVRKLGKRRQVTWVATERGQRAQLAA